MHLKIVCHRGSWRSADEQNAVSAFERAFDAGFGVETDLRDCGGAVVIAHDPPVATSPFLSLEDFLSLRAARDGNLPLALNIKADGLHRPVRAALERSGVDNAFVFDMSVPDTLGYLALGVPVYVRHSDVEPVPTLYDRAAGVWLDQFYTDWIDGDVIARHLEVGKTVCLVSPELHKRDHRRQWERLSASPVIQSPDFLLCTDFPEQAQEVFHVLK